MQHPPPQSKEHGPSVWAAAKGGAYTECLANQSPMKRSYPRSPRCAESVHASHSSRSDSIGCAFGQGIAQRQPMPSVSCSETLCCAVADNSAGYHICRLTTPKKHDCYGDHWLIGRFTLVVRRSIADVGYDRACGGQSPAKESCK